jgi:PadR family transcriptional regulator, regulatory protein PadR
MPRDYLGEFEHQVLLTLLRLGAEAYSVPILLELEERTGRAVQAAAIYIALRRLEERGLVRSELREPEAGEGGRDRRFFVLTPLGITRLSETRAALQRLWDGIEPLLEGRPR